VVTQIARAADPRIPPGQSRHFAIDILDPPTTAHDLEVSFAAAKAEAAHGPAKTEAKAAQAAEAPHDSGDEGLRSGAPEPAPVEAQPLAPGDPLALDHQ
jgi:hypothetical protein